MREHDDAVDDVRGVSRRGFIASVGTSAVAAVATVGLARAAGETPASPPTGEVGAGQTVPVTLVVNGHTHRLEVEPRWSLLYVVRDRIGLSGTKPGCERGECGACTVLIDGEPRYACMTLAVEADGRAITTVEGLLDGEQPGLVQQAFAEEDGFQCGYCTSGQVMTVEGLLRASPDPTSDEIRHALAGNLCRCGAYVHIFRAAGRAAALKRQGGTHGA
jgi:xanthine dehydrogenase YagT iron-sulfur-binding subunit